MVLVRQTWLLAKVAFVLLQSTRCQFAIVALADALAAVADTAKVVARAAVSRSAFMMLPSRIGEAVASMYEGNLATHAGRRSDRGHARTVTGVTDAPSRL